MFKLRLFTLQRVKMRIYTKTGDSGETSLYGGKRVLKSDLRIEAYGSVDELNSLVGIITTEIKSSKLKVQNYSQKLKVDRVLEEIQKELFIIGSILAGYKLQIKNSKLKIKSLEQQIDGLEKELPELRNFILPGGSRVASLLHLARSVCRRTERRVVELSQKETIDKNIIIYLNRLSDLFFEMARFVNKAEKIQETVWSR